MTVLRQNFVATALSRAGILYTYSDIDDIKSLRRWVQRGLSPETDATHDPDPGNPWVFIEPISGTFKRPAVTIRLLPTSGIVTQRDPSANYAVLHRFILTSYHEDHDTTVELGQRLWKLFWEGGDPALARHRVPMWAFSLNARLSRYMAVLPESLTQDLTETNEQGQWSRALNVSIRSPRFRMPPDVAKIESVGASVDRA